MTDAKAEKNPTAYAQTQQNDDSEVTKNEHLQRTETPFYPQTNELQHRMCETHQNKREMTTKKIRTGTEHAEDVPCQPVILQHKV